jgi:hypothetical protein
VQLSIFLSHAPLKQIFSWFSLFIYLFSSNIILEQINADNTEVSNSFYQIYFLHLLQDLFYILTDTFHKSGMFQILWMSYIFFFNVFFFFIMLFFLVIIIYYLFYILLQCLFFFSIMLFILVIITYYLFYILTDTFHKSGLNELYILLQCLFFPFLSCYLF